MIVTRRPSSSFRRVLPYDDSARPLTAKLLCITRQELLAGVSIVEDLTKPRSPPIATLAWPVLGSRCSGMGFVSPSPSQ